MELSALPADCLRLILLRLPLTLLIHLRPVCTQWLQVIDSICLSVHTLHLFNSSSGSVEAYKRDAINYQIPVTLNEHESFLVLVCKSTKHIASAKKFIPLQFPNVTKLTIMYYGLDKLDPGALLKQWPHLEQLCMYGMMQFTNMTNRSRATYYKTQFWKGLEGNTSLRSLHIMGIDGFCLPAKPEKLQSLLSQLEHFTMSHYTERDLCSRFLAHLGPNCNHLTVDWTHFTVSEFLNLLNTENKTLSQSLTHLSLINLKDSTTNIKYSKNLFECIAESMVNLEYLRVDLSSHANPVSLVSLAQILVNLSSLKSLHVKVNFHSLDQGTTKTPPLKLPNIKWFQMDDYCICLFANLNEPQVQLSSIFHNAKQFIVKINCSRCRIRGRGGDLLKDEFVKIKFID